VSEHHNVHRVVWRLAIAYRVVFPLIGALFLWVGLVPWSDSQGFWSDLPTRAIGLFLAAMFLTIPFRPRIELSTTHVIAHGILFSRTIPLRSLSRAEAGYYGITLVDDSGRAFTATGVGERWNIAVLLKRTTDADRLADRLMIAAAKARTGP